MSTHNIYFYGELEKIIPHFSPNTSLSQFLFLEVVIFVLGPTFPTRLHVRPVKTQIRLCIHAVWSDFVQGTLRVDKDPEHLETNSKFWLACTYAQAYLSLSWAHMQSCKKCCVVAHFSYLNTVGTPEKCLADAHLMSTQGSRYRSPLSPFAQKN